MNFIINNQENFQSNSSIHKINTRNKYHLHKPNANLTCFKKCILCWHQNFWWLITVNPHEWKGKIYSSVKTLLKYTLLVLCRWVFHVWRWSTTLFCKIFIAFDIVKIVYICVFMTCSKSCCHCYTLTDPLNICMYISVCVCVCVCVCVYECMYVSLAILTVIRTDCNTHSPHTHVCTHDMYMHGHTHAWAYAHAQTQS